jgi:hypothetical protein
LWSCPDQGKVTASRKDIDISMAYELGIISYVVNPVGLEALAEVVKQIMFHWLLINGPPSPNGMEV